MYLVFTVVLSYLLLGRTYYNIETDIILILSHLVYVIVYIYVVFFFTEKY